MKRSKGILRDQGFTFIELTIVIAVVSILSALSIVVYTHFLKKARRVEAHRVLSDLTKQEEAYYVAHDEYTDNLDSLGLPTLGNQKFYDITITVPAGSQSFLATARGNIDSDPVLDEWTIDKDKTIRHTVED